MNALKIVPVVVIALCLCSCNHSEDNGLQWPHAAPTEAYRHSVAALLWPGATRAYQVTADGNLYNGAWFVNLRPAAGESTAVPPSMIAFEDRWCPVAHWTRLSGSALWDFEAVAYPEPEPLPWSPRGVVARWAAARARALDRAKVEASLAGVSRERLSKLLLRVRQPIEFNPIDRRNLFVSLRIRAKNVGSQPTDARLVMELEPQTLERPYWDPDSLIRTPWEHCWEASRPVDSLLGMGIGQPSGRVLMRSWHLMPGDSITTRAILPAYPTPAAQLQAQMKASHESQVKRVRSFWHKEIERGTYFDIPDPELKAASYAARVTLLGCRERRDLDWVPIGNPFQYRDVWVRDGARVTQALAVSGYTNEARQFVHAFLRFQSPIGTLTSQRAQLDGTGQALWAFEQALLRPQPAPDLDRYAPAVVAAWRALQGARLQNDSAAPVTAVGMLPLTDPHDAELVRAQLTGNDAWAIAGYRAAERLLRAAGYSATADSIQCARLAYMGLFRRHLRELGADIPPSWQRIGIDWGNLNVGYPCAVLPAENLHLIALANRYWKPVAGPGLGYYRNPDSLHTYVAADLGTWALLRGDHATAERMLDSLLLWRSASGGAAEVFARSTRDYGHNFPPHTTAAAALLTLTRNMVVFDDADTLMLTMGARPTWWTGSAVRGAPTRWGKIDITFQRRGASAYWEWTPVSVWTALVLPAGTRIEGALPLPLQPGPRPDVVLAPPKTSRVQVELQPSRGIEAHSGATASPRLQ